jgi:hypothetical protein
VNPATKNANANANIKQSVNKGDREPRRTHSLYPTRGVDMSEAAAVKNDANALAERHQHPSAGKKKTGLFRLVNEMK